MLGIILFSVKFDQYLVLKQRDHRFLRRRIHNQLFIHS